MKVNKSVRIRTTPGGGEKTIGVKLTQEFDTIDFLSLKITQEEAYQNFCSDYGVVAGRVIANDGFGIQNAKVSIFIPLSDEDAENPIISSIYPFSTPLDKNSEDIRYNLLPKDGREFDVIIQIPLGDDPINNPITPEDYLPNPNITSLGSFEPGSEWVSETEVGQEIPGYGRWRRTVIGNGPKVPVGTFPSKSEILENDSVLEVYDKYYKFTTTTNSAGDYMLFGVPIGQATVHMDVDLSDAGSATLTPSDLINIGFPSSAFQDDGNGNYSFKASTNLDELPQLETQNLSVDVVPFWGDLEQCEVGITRLDFNLSKTISPSALLIFEAFTNGNNYSLRPNCSGVLNNAGNNKYNNMSEMKNLGVGVEGIALNNGGRDLNSVQFIDGKVIFPIPMYEQRKITNEFGDIEDGDDANGIGVPTAGKYNIYVYSLEGNVTGDSDVDLGYANHLIDDVTYRYDLLNGERLIYTPGNWNSDNGERIAINSSGGPNQDYPRTFDGGFGAIDGNIDTERNTPICFGSIYFPRFRFNVQSDGDFEFCTQLARDFSTDDDYPNPSNGGVLIYQGTSGVRVGIKGVLNITKLKNIFKPFGGGLDTTSANLNVFGGFTIDPGADDVDISNQTIIVNSSSGQADSNGDVTFTTNNPVYNDQIPPQNEWVDYNTRLITFPNGNLDTPNGNIWGSPSSELSGTIQKEGRYFFYFGLKKNDTVLDKLKNTF